MTKRKKKKENLFFYNNQLHFLHIIFHSSSFFLSSHYYFFVFAFFWESYSLGSIQFATFIVDSKKTNNFFFLQCGSVCMNVVIFLIFVVCCWEISIFAHILLHHQMVRAIVYRKTKQKKCSNICAELHRTKLHLVYYILEIFKNEIGNNSKKKFAIFFYF